MEEDYKILSEDLENLENNLITVINDLKTSTEIILKELTGYLNVSAHDLSEIRSSVIKIETVLDTLKDYINKLDNIEKEINSIKPIIDKSENNIINTMTNSFNTNVTNMKKIAGFINNIQKLILSKDVENDKRLTKIENQIRYVAVSFKDTKDELIKSQTGLYNIINNLTINQTDIKKAEVSLQGSKIKSDTEKHKNKLLLITKIIGIFFGSSGILFLIIQYIINLG